MEEAGRPTRPGPPPGRRLAAFLRSFRDDPVRRNVVLLVNLGGILVGFLYYEPQFLATPVHLWPLVPDSPFAVLVATAALLLWGAGKGRPVVDVLAFVYLVKVGLWTAFVLALHPAHFGFSPVGASLNTVLFYLHLGMAAEGAIFLVDMGARARDVPGSAAKDPHAPAALHAPRRAAWSAVLFWFLFNDAMDYAWTGHTFPLRACPGLFPWTVPCDHLGLVALVTVGLSVGLVGLAWGWTRWRGRRAPGEGPGPTPGPGS